MPVWAKMTPNITDISFPARSAPAERVRGGERHQHHHLCYGRQPGHTPARALCRGLHHPWRLLQQGSQAHCPCQGVLRTCTINRLLFSDLFIFLFISQAWADGLSKGPCKSHGLCDARLSWQLYPVPASGPRVSNSSSALNQSSQQNGKTGMGRILCHLTVHVSDDAKQDIFWRCMWHVRALQHPAFTSCGSSKHDWPQAPHSGHVARAA